MLGPAPFTIFATVALVLTPVLSGLAIFVTTPPKSTKVYAIVEDSKSNGSRGSRNYCTFTCISPTVYLKYLVTAPPKANLHA
jgi:hypothetical protein